MSEPTFSADYWFNVAQNDAETYKLITSSLRSMRAALRRLAVKGAKANALWHDDPESDDHADYHAPPEEQFPTALRDEVLIDLLRYHVGECQYSDNVPA